MSHLLFVDSSNSVTLEPEWDFEQGQKKNETVHRTRAGNRFVYKWGEFETFKFSLNFVDSSTAAIVNSWWNTNTELLFSTDGGVTVSSVQLTNRSKPLARFNMPYDDEYKGKIELETY